MDVNQQRLDILEEGLAGFVRRAWNHIPEFSHKPFLDGRIVDCISEHLEAVTLGEIRTLIINVPPGHMKSLLTSVMWPAWEWSFHPDKKWLVSSFDHNLTVRDGIRLKNLIKSDWYQALYPHLHVLESTHGKLDNARDTQREYYTNYGGWRFSTSVSSKSTGHHPDRIIVDDPIKPNDVYGSIKSSGTALEKNEIWWSGTMESRGQKPSRVLIMQRLAEGDLSEYFLSRYPDATHLNLPFISDGEPKKTIIGGDWRTERGEVLWPEKFDEEEVDEKKKSPFFEEQYQQAPGMRGGNLIKIDEWASWYDKPPQLDQIIMSWDLTFDGKSTSDYVVGQVWGASGSNYYLIDQFRGQWDVAETCIRFIDLCIKYPHAGLKLIEKAANGSAVERALRKRIAGIQLEPDGGGTYVRAQSSTIAWREGRIFLPKNGGQFLDDFIFEHKRYPKVKNDDTVAASSQAICYLEASTNSSRINALIEARSEMSSLFR